MDLTFVVLFLIAFLIIIIFLFVYLKNSIVKKQEESLNNVYNKTLNEALIKLTELSKTSLLSEKENIQTDLKNKKELIEKIVSDIAGDLEKRHKELTDTRAENMRLFGDIKRQIEEHQKVTKDLETSAHKLSNILSQNQVRGEWGEKILEDILISAGLEKGVHYLKQETMENKSRPDIVILLPEKRTLNIDAKFPLANILKMNESTEKAQAVIFKKAFEGDVKTKLRDIEKREYINSDEGTLDFAVMFVPNEVVFSYINKEFPSIVDEAFAKKIIIASPFSVYAIARTIMQGYRNYYYEQNLKDVLKNINTLKEQFGKFSNEFEKLGRSFEGVYKDYKQISDTRVSMLNKSFKNIELSSKSKVIPKLLED